MNRCLIGHLHLPRPATLVRKAGCIIIDSLLRYSRSIVILFIIYMTDVYNRVWSFCFAFCLVVVDMDVVVVVPTMRTDDFFFFLLF